MSILVVHNFIGTFIKRLDVHRFIFALFILNTIGCNEEPRSVTLPKAKSPKLAFQQHRIARKVIDIVPFRGTPDTVVEQLAKRLIPFFGKPEIKAIISLPANAWYQPRKRFKADTLLCHLASITPKGHVSLGVTLFDISTSNGSIEDWGVFGYGYMPGNACVVSLFRLHQDKLMDELFKIAVHELGHTQGLGHCSNKTCIMRDAEGKNSMAEETGFCNECKNKLAKKGWAVSQ